MILSRQWMVFMSLVIDLIGQLNSVMLLAVRLVNCHVIGCKIRNG